MKNRQYLICPIFLFALLPGCQTLHAYRPVSVMARDAETKKPIPGAEVRISYPLSRPSRAPNDSVETTGADGIARLQAAPYGEEGVLIEVAANGYMDENKTLTVEAVQAIEPAHWFEKVEKRPVNYILELYADPHPTVELVVTTGYRGTVKAAVEVRDDAPCVVGQRVFSYVVPPPGVVQVVGPHLLGRVGSADFRIKYADGTPLTSEANGAVLGCWCLKFDGEVYHFFIGTRSEYDALRPSSIPQDSGPAHSTGGKGSGQGKRGHKGGGNQPPADPGT